MPTKARSYLTNDKRRIHRVRRKRGGSGGDADFLQAYRIIERKDHLSSSSHLSDLSGYAAAIQHLQQTSGNAAIQRFLATLPAENRQANALQLEKGEAEAKEEGAKGKPEKEPAFNLDQWLSGKVYELVKEQVGEAKLKEYAKELAKKAGDLLLKQIGEINSEADLVTKAQNKVIGELFAQDIQKAVQEILKSPAGAKLKDLILKQAQQEPGSIIGLVLTALAFMAATNADIPEIELEKKFGKGFQVAGKANLGKFQDLALKQLKLSIGYSSESFNVSVAGEHKEPGGKKLSLSMRDETLATEEEKKFKTDPNVTTSGELNLGMDMKSFGAKASILYGSPNKWLGVYEFRLGEKNFYWAPKIVIGPDQKLSFALGNRFNADGLQFYNTLFPGKDKTTISHYLKLDKPFGAEGLNVEASLSWRMDEPKIMGARLAGQYRLLEKKPGHPFPVMYLKIEGNYQAAGEGKPAPEFMGLIYLWGAW